MSNQKNLKPLMSVRLTSFSIVSGNSPLLHSIIATLNDSYVRDTTAIGLLTALAQTESFQVYATGDYDCLLDSTELMQEEPSEDAIEWLSSITAHLTELSL